MKIEIDNIRDWKDMIWLVGRIGAPIKIHCGWFTFTLEPEGDDRDPLYALPVLLKLG